MQKQNIEVEGGEIILESNEGHYAIIPAKHRQEVMDMVKNGCDECVNNYIQTLPKDSDYAEDGTVVSELYEQKTGKDWSTAHEEGLTTGSYEDNMKLRQRLLSGEFDNEQFNVVKQEANIQNNSTLQNQDDIIVSELYEQKTGKEWRTAHEEGLTDGSYNNNMKLRERLLSGEFDELNVEKPKNREKNEKDEILKEIKNIDIEEDLQKDVESNIDQYKDIEPNKKIENIKIDSSFENSPEDSTIIKTKNNNVKKVSSKIAKEIESGTKENINKTIDRKIAFSNNTLNFAREHYEGTDKKYYFIVDKPTQSLFQVNSKTGEKVLKGKVGLGKNVGDRDVSKGRLSGKGTNKTQSGWVRINREVPFSYRNTSYGDEFNGFEAFVDGSWKEIPTGIHGTEHETEGRVSGGCTRLNCELEKELKDLLNEGTLIFYTSDKTN